MNNLINEPKDRCYKCGKMYPKDEITDDNICLNCLDIMDYLAEMEEKRILENYFLNKGE